MKKEKIETFADWKDLFLKWQKDIGYDRKLFATVLKGYEFGEKFFENGNGKIKFGQFAGDPSPDRPYEAAAHYPGRKSSCGHSSESPESVVAEVL